MSKLWSLLVLCTIGKAYASIGPFRKMFPVIQDPPTPLNTNETGEPLFLSPMITKGEWKLAQRMARVDGRQFGEEVANVDSYSGYLTVNAPDCKSNLFFWYFPAMVSSHFSLFKNMPL